MRYDDTNSFGFLDSQISEENPKLLTIYKGFSDLRKFIPMIHAHHSVQKETHLNTMSQFEFSGN